MPNYVAYCARVRITKHNLVESNDGMNLSIIPDEFVAGDDHKLYVEFVSHDPSRVHEMIRSFEGQKVKITVEVES